MSRSPRGRRALQAAGFLVSLLSLGAVIWWASRQEAPSLPNAPAELAALAGALATYAAATVGRSERWWKILVREGARPEKADAYGLTLVGFMGNNVLPARGGDALRVYMMAPRAHTSMRSVLGTLVAERLLDVGTLLALFSLLAYGVLRGIDTPNTTSLLLALTLGLLFLSAGIVAVRLARHSGRGSRALDFLKPMASASRNLSGRHGIGMLAITVVIWVAEGFTYLLAAKSVGLDWSYVDALYVLGVAGVFVLVPAGPGYAGTLDAALVFGASAVGSAGGEAVAFLIMLRFVLLVPITAAGLIVFVLRYRGGLGGGPAVETRLS